MEIVFSLEEINKAVLIIIQRVQDKKCICFYGEMGSGKTTLINALCKYFEVDDRVSSPTYSIINEYYSHLVGTIHHMDWYRLKDIEEAVEAGVEDAIETSNLCLIEWPEKFPELIPLDCLQVQLSTLENSKHRLTILP